MINLWFNYPISKATSFMRAGGWVLTGHVLRVGPIAFIIAWRKTEDAADSLLEQLITAEDVTDDASELLEAEGADED